MGPVRWIPALFLLGLAPPARAEPPSFHLATSTAAAARNEAVRSAFGRRPVPTFFTGAQLISTPRFACVVDRGRSLPAPPWATDDAYAEAFELARSAVAAREPERAALMLVFSTFRDGGRALFYTALSNDVSGLGEGDEARIFDASPDSPIEGYAWLGALEALDEGGPSFAEEAFLHEIAHRWAAYVRIQHPDLAPEALLGRTQAHWSFFFDTQGSAMEGNRWVGTFDGLYRTEFARPPIPTFSPLDLYLMGVLPPERVEAMYLLEGSERVIPSWFTPRAEEAPAHRLGFEVQISPRTVHTVTMDHVLGGSGPRIPATSQPVLPIWVVLLDDGHGDVGLDALRRFDARLQSFIEAFARATGGRMSLDPTLASAGHTPLGEPCSATEDCDRLSSDRCAAPPGLEPVCSRACSAHQDCDSGCCFGDESPGLCGPRLGGACPPPPGPAGSPDAGMKADASSQGPNAGDLGQAESRCRCTKAGSGGAAGWGLLLAALLLGQRSSRLRQSRRRPPAASDKPALR